MISITVSSLAGTETFYPHECADFFEGLRDRYERIVSFHLSTELSGNDNSTMAALNLMLEEDARRGKVVDLRSVSASLRRSIKRWICCAKTATWRAWEGKSGLIWITASWGLRSGIQPNYKRAVGSAHWRRSWAEC